eukprot:TRINITY_DN2085_c0_g1_i4.p1 TRINITY_DN2085_c0_g1~~TRINITY_DN2085_c0_g1_i4.p1  ORF type:complete len:347 (+),score=93.81 TRINITY_DN2085_c0_g1_i4:97-1137(+)
MKPFEFAALMSFAIGSFVTRVQLLWSYGFELRWWWRVALLILVSFVTIPLRMIERMVSCKRIKREELRNPPVFILGHWRSGTTFLHQLMAQDPQFGFVPSYQVFASRFSELLEIPFFMACTKSVMPANRGFDNVELHSDEPQEEELAVADRLPYSIFHYFCFPKNAKDLLRFTTMDNVTQKQYTSVKNAYDTVLRKASVFSKGKTLLVKNPANTGRVPLLLEMYPNAKFIHISRNPYRVFCSTYHQHVVMTQACSLQATTKQLLYDNVILFFKTVTERYLRTKSQIPEGHLTEIRFEDLMNDPVNQMKRMYGELGLTGFDKALPHFDVRSLHYIHQHVNDTTHRST